MVGQQSRRVMEEVVTQFFGDGLKPLTEAQIDKRVCMLVGKSGMGLAGRYHQLTCFLLLSYSMVTDGTFSLIFCIYKASFAQ